MSLSSTDALLTEIRDTLNVLVQLHCQMVIEAYSEESQIFQDVSQMFPTIVKSVIKDGIQ